MVDPISLECDYCCGRVFLHCSWYGTPRGLGFVCRVLITYILKNQFFGRGTPLLYYVVIVIALDGNGFERCSQFFLSFSL